MDWSNLDGQMDIFDFLSVDETPKQIVHKLIKKPIRLIETFAGYGSQALALKKIGANFEHWKMVEFDKYAVDSYNAIHGTNFPVSDIRDIHAENLEIRERESFTYLLTYSFPCTDLSVAGQQKGMSRDSGTRSGLLWEVERILKECGDNLPQVLFMENVPQVHGAKAIDDFREWLHFLESKGYVNFWKDLNAKDYGVAQNRNRTFMFSFLKSEFGEDVKYEFPQPIKLEKRLVDYLEDDVPDNMYVTSDKAQKLLEQLVTNGTIFEIIGSKKNKITCTSNFNRMDNVNTKIAKTICARDYKGFGTTIDTMNSVLEINNNKAL